MRTLASFLLLGLLGALAPPAAAGPHEWFHAWHHARIHRDFARGYRPYAYRYRYRRYAYRPYRDRLYGYRFYGSGYSGYRRYGSPFRRYLYGPALYYYLRPYRRPAVATSSMYTRFYTAFSLDDDLFSGPGR